MPSRSVLIVDDDPEMCRMLVEVLQDRGLEAKYAVDVDQALGLLEGEHFSAVVSDIRMSPRDGFELLEAVRRLEAAPPVILMTSFATCGTAHEVREAGAFAFIKKPFLPSQLSDLIERAMALANGAPTR